jgi:hypothetical protein
MKTITLAGRVNKLIDRSKINETQQAQIAFEGAETLYDELRVPNIHGWELGEAIEVTIRPHVSG